MVLGAIWVWYRWIWGRRNRVPASRIPERKQAVRAGCPVARDLALQRRGPESAPLHALGSGQWDKAKRKAAQQIRDTAAELLNLYARRALREGHSFPLEARDYAKFAESFGFEETPDQAAAITAVIGDMTSGKPMDRLVCGDVGFGKTEVALRAAFIAVMGASKSLFFHQPPCSPNSIRTRSATGSPTGR